MARRSKRTGPRCSTEASGNTPALASAPIRLPPPTPRSHRLWSGARRYDQLTSPTPVYFTAAQQKQADALNKEINGWNALLADSHERQWRQSRS